MYRKERPIVLKGTASSLSNNLSVLATPEQGTLNYCVVHKSSVNIVTASTDGTTVTGRRVVCKEQLATQGSVFVMQAKWVVLPVRTLLIVTTQRSVQMFEPDGSVLVYWHALCVELDESNYGRGITGVGENILCVGMENGEILVFSIPTKGSNISYQDTLKAHKSAVTDLASSYLSECWESRFVSGDERGTVIVWKTAATANMQQLFKIPGSGSPCTSISLWRNAIVCAFGSGHIRVYSGSSGKISSEVLAHARWINAVSISEETGMVLSVSDDAFFKVWKLGEGTFPQMSYLDGQLVEDVQLVGGQFVDKDGQAICLTGYDNSEIKFYIKK